MRTVHVFILISCWFFISFHILKYKPFDVVAEVFARKRYLAIKCTLPNQNYHRPIPLLRLTILNHQANDMRATYARSRQSYIEKIHYPTILLLTAYVSNSFPNSFFATSSAQHTSTAFFIVCTNISSVQFPLSLKSFKFSNSQLPST